MRPALGLLVAVVVLAGCSTKPVDEDEVPETGPTAAVHTRLSGPRPTPQPAATQTGEPQATTVAIGSLRRGDEPAVAWFDPVTQELHDGDRYSAIGLTHVVGLVRAGDDFLVQDGDADAVDIHRVEPDGTRHLLVRGAQQSLATSPDGDLFAYTRTAQGKETVVVARTSDGSTVAQQQFRNAPLGYVVEPVALDGHRVLLTRSDLTWWWDYHDQSELVLTHGRAGAVSPRHDRVAASLLEDETRWQVADQHGEDDWSLPLRWVPRGFSPDGSLLLSGRVIDFDPPGFARGDRSLRISDSRTGEPLWDLRGSFENTAMSQPTWESGSTFLALAGSPRRDVGRASAQWVRCRLSGGCEAASPVFRFDSDSSNPPVWVLDSAH